MSERFDEEHLRAALRGSPFGDPLRLHPVAVTAESLALGWARQHDAPEGALVVAEQELSARVRRAVPWVSQAGRSLAFSVVVRPDLPPQGEGLLWLLTSLAAAEGVEHATGLDVRLKWPNDLLVHGRRLGGIRVDAHLGPGVVEVAVLTVRINVGGSPDDLGEDLRDPVTTVAAALDGDPPDRSEILAAILEGLAARYEAPVPDLLAAYRARCDTLDRRVRAELMPQGEAHGVAVDVSETGGLVLETPSGRGTVAVDRLARLHLP